VQALALYGACRFINFNAEARALFFKFDRSARFRVVHTAHEPPRFFFNRLNRTNIAPHHPACECGQRVLAHWALNKLVADAAQGDDTLLLLHGGASLRSKCEVLHDPALVHHPKKGEGRRQGISATSRSPSRRRCANGACTARSCPKFCALLPPGSATAEDAVSGIPLPSAAIFALDLVVRGRATSFAAERPARSFEG
jgi:hypothetical protein